MISLLTDFGTADHFVGVMKGVIATIAPETRVVDLSHHVPAYAIAEAAFLLEQSWHYFPMGTIHVAVVDPGVGSERRPLLLEAGGHFFIGPDNGLFSFVLERDGVQTWVLDQPRFWLPLLSGTFHGRDVFAPVAAHLSSGVAPSSLGSPIADAHQLPRLLPVPQTPRDWTGAVLRVDRFGNLVTNFRVAQFSELGAFALVAGAERVELRASTYAKCPPGVLCLIEGSSGYYEVSLAQASAAERTGLHAGSPLELHLG
ncbi:SAM hydrolase/SAM-dependent halogenase family protein [Bryobacter aggregatus]|uniref:SAM hydrolase/SAM-dependent halogenase family protein n=1 Tax=Bryobacter aggregatus TaxID=360054 RepID=UPI0004E0B012|nr:SAM-dependent chlorinase/fluorinase [Bryobacter aggregatus]